MTRSSRNEVLRGLPDLGDDSINPVLLNFATMRFTTLPDLPTILTMSQVDFPFWRRSKVFYISGEETGRRFPAAMLNYIGSNTN